MTSTNPLLQSYTVPPMDKIKVEHYVPAIEHAIAEAQKKVAALKQDKSKPDFENTVVALDEVFADINRITNVTGTIAATDQQEAVLDACEEMDKKVLAFTSAVFQDLTLGDRFKQVAEPSVEEDKTLYRNLKLEFESKGALLSADGQKRLNAIDNRLIELCTAFNTNCAEGAKQQAVLFTDPADLEGIPESIVSSMRANAQTAGKEGWRFVPERLQVNMLLEVAASPKFRETIFKALAKIGTEEPYDNAPVIQEIQALRHERSNMLGYPNFASYQMARNMPENVGEVETVLKKVGDGAMAKFADSIGKVQAYARSNGGPRKLEPWDVSFWAGKYREEAYNFDAQKFSEYLPLDKAIDGFFQTAERIFNIRFEENTDYPTYHPDVKTYDVINATTGEKNGILYADMYAREDKSGGAWMTQVQAQTPGHPNIVSMNMNLVKPEGGQPSLLSLDDLETLFHEGGHAVHGLLGTKTRHASLQGPNASSDFIEFFSMVLENWPKQKECLDSFARHYKTGEAIPDELMEARQEAGDFMNERTALLLVQNSLRDFAFHTQDPASYTSSTDLQAEADLKHPLADHIGSYPLQRWSHLFGEALSGYAAGYYGYLWSQGLSDMGFKPFSENGIFDGATCEHMKKIYELGSSHDQTKAYEDYHGSKVTPDTMAAAILEGIGADKPALRDAGKAANAR